MTVALINRVGTCPTCQRADQPLEQYLDRNRDVYRWGCVDQHACCDAYAELRQLDRAGRTYQRQFCTPITGVAADRAHEQRRADS